MQLTQFCTNILCLVTQNIYKLLFVLYDRNSFNYFLDMKIMADRKTYALLPSDTFRLDELVELVNVELERLGIKKVNRTSILRALIFSAKKMNIEDLVEGVKQAQIYA